MIEGLFLVRTNQKQALLFGNRMLLRQEVNREIQLKTLMAVIITLKVTVAIEKQDLPKLLSYLHQIDWSQAVSSSLFFQNL